MFKFVESKAFFYFSAFMSFLCNVSGIRYLGGNLSRICQVIFVGMIIIAMAIFYTREHKELMKALLAAFITIVFLGTFMGSLDVIFNFPARFQEYNLQYVKDPIRVVVASFTLLATPTLILLLFINHFILNFNGEASKVFININKAIVLIMIFGLFFDKTSMFVASAINGNELLLLPSKIYLVAVHKNIHVIFDALTIVSVEAFINTQRALKENNS